MKVPNPNCPTRRGNFGGKGPHFKVLALSAVSCAETAEPIDFPIWDVDSGVLKEAQVQSYLPGGANVPSPVGTLVPPGKHD